MKRNAKKRTRKIMKKIMKKVVRKEVRNVTRTKKTKETKERVSHGFETHSSVYEPREDSMLMADQVRQYAKGLVLDMGAGSGVQAATALENPLVKHVYAADINAKAVAACSRRFRGKPATCMKSDLFAAFRRGKLKKLLFDTIIFNPPYLPDDKAKRDPAVDGGKHGYEVIKEFLESASSHLKPDCTILLLFSSLSNKHKVEEFIEKNLFISSQVASTHFFFEDLYVYKLHKLPVVQELEKNGFADIRYLAKGHRGIIFTAMRKGKTVVVKSKNPLSHAKGRMENEAKFLKITNQRGIGPTLIESTHDYVVMEFVQGDTFKHRAEKASRKDLLRWFVDLFHQAFTIDQLSISKEEMHNPVKHILITPKDKVVLVDFERSHITGNPHNVTQTATFLLKNIPLFKKKGIALNDKEIIYLAQRYSNDKTRENLNALLKVFEPGHKPVVPSPAKKEKKQEKKEEKGKGKKRHEERERKQGNGEKKGKRIKRKNAYASQKRMKRRGKNRRGR